MSSSRRVPTSPRGPTTPIRKNEKRKKFINSIFPPYFIFENANYNHSRFLGAGHFGQVFLYTKESPVTTVGHDCSLDGTEAIDELIVNHLMYLRHRPADQPHTKSLPNEIAVKCIRNVRTSLRELFVHSHVSHRHIVRMYCHCSSLDNQHVYIATEYCNGGSLMDIFNRNKLSSIDLRMKQIILSSLCQALVYLKNTKKVIHCDVKLDNVLIHNGVVKLADFGCAQKHAVEPGAEDTPTVHPIVGTPMYHAPEIFRTAIGARGNAHTAYYDFKIDVWSLGVIMYLLHYNKYPWPGVSVHNSCYHNLQLIESVPIATLIATESPIGDVDLSHDARDLLVRMLDPDPHERLSPSQILHHPYLSRYGDSSCTQ